jgi:hypothetical protein
MARLGASADCHVGMMVGVYLGASMVCSAAGMMGLCRGRLSRQLALVVLVAAGAAMR